MVGRLIVGGVGSLLALGWPPDLRHRWWALVPLTLVLIVLTVAYVMARLSERPIKVETLQLDRD
jgi:hypothetical protein